MDYYGDMPYSEELYHYGVKGMKWGVRKAIERGNQVALSRHYGKALRKLKKLNAKADVKRSQREVRGHLHNAGSLAAAGAVNAGLAAGLNAAGVAGGGFLPIGAGIGALGAGYHLVRAAAAKNRTNAAGHDRAKEKARSFKQEMERSFKGTKYAKLPGSNSMSRAYQYSSAGKQLKNAAKVSVTSPYYVASKNAANSVKPHNNLSKKQVKQINQGMKNWADAFEKHYQTGLSKGMTHEQAERYSNDYIAKHGFKPVAKRKR